MVRLITDEMFDSVPSLVEEGLSKVDIAKRFGVTPSTLQVQCCRRGISLRRGGRSRRAVNLYLPSEPLSLSEAVVNALKEKARAMNKAPAELATALLERIVHDDLFVAVLDVEDA